MDDVAAADLRVPEIPPLGRRAGIDLFDAIGTTRSIRRFRPDPIPEADLATMMFAASRAPTGSNRQAVRYVVLRDSPKAREAKELLVRGARAVWDGKKTEDRYDEGSGTAASSPKARMAAAMDHFVDHFVEVPVVVLPCLLRYRAASPTEGGSVYPGVQNLLLTARGLGYGGVLTGFNRAVDDELHELLAIPAEAAIHAAIALGRPVGGHGPVRRRPAAELVYDGEWGAEAGWVEDPPGTAHTAAGPPT